MKSFTQFTLKRTDYDRAVMEASRGCRSLVDTQVRKISQYTIEECQLVTQCSIGIFN